MESLPGRRPSSTSKLIRAGFNDLEYAQKLLREIVALGAFPASESAEADWVAEFSSAPDPDAAVLALVRLSENEAARPFLRSIAGNRRALHRLLSVLGGSVALADHLVKHPHQLTVLAEPDGLDVSPDEVRADLLRAVGASGEVPVARNGSAEAIDELRIAYRRRLLAIAAQDLASKEPKELFPQVGSALADLAGATLEAALAVARAQTPDYHLVRLAVIGMGKTGGRELNYISDVDVIYVAEPSEGAEEEVALAVATELASSLAQVCSQPTSEPTIWQVDPNLRPEGKNGPLVRTLASHRSYYDRWAQAWEFQALLKARTVAGDSELGQRYIDMTRPMVWRSVEREGFVEAAQAMRRRVEEHVPAGESERQIKLGRGGLRDVEFTVQLLQLVHGRADESLRSANTLEALGALQRGGYIGRTDAERLDDCYRQLRVLEHRVQLVRLRRTHLIPTDSQHLRQLARAARIEPADSEGLRQVWDRTRREVRVLHQEAFYRPLLPETARLSAGEAVLAPEAARQRLEALGYRDPAGALRHIEALTEGLSRRAAIQRQLLPVLLGWFAEGADPDLGLLGFRRISDSLGSTPWYLRMLRDSSGAAFRLSHVLAASRFIGSGLERNPESVVWFGDDDDLLPRTKAQLDSELSSLLVRREEPRSASRAIRSLRQREMLRQAIAMAAELVETRPAAAASTAVAESAIAGALRIARVVASADLNEAPVTMAVIAMGSLGGSEIGLASDADVLFVHDPVPGADGAEAQSYAVQVAGMTRSLLGEVGPEPALEVDVNLRPEGKGGPISRSLAAYRAYYERWALGWERQALLRARPIAGDAELGARFIEMINPLRYRSEFDHGELYDLRRMKSRIESERLPRGVEPARHVKLGPGGLIDVQWIAQLLQMRYAGEVHSLRVTGTLESLAAAAVEGLIGREDHDTLTEAWLWAMRLRDANVLWTGRAGETANILPHDTQDALGIAALLGFPAGSAQLVEEEHLRITRRARRVFERVFYDD